MEIENTEDHSINFAANYALLLKLEAPHFSRKYGCVLSFSDGTETNRLKYEIEITYLKTIPEVARLFKIDRVSPVYINNSEPDLLVDQLAHETGKVFYPLVAEVDFDGQLLRISNVEEIQERWIKVKEDISGYFTGEHVEKYLELMDLAITDEDQLNEAIQNDLVLSTYFSSIYKAYTFSLKVETDRYFPLSGRGKPIQFKVTEEVEPALNSFQAITLHCNGIVNDERSALDIEEEQFFPIHRLNDPAVPAATGSYQALYILNKDTRAIESVVATWKLALSAAKEIEVKIFEMETEASLKALNGKPSSGSALFYLDGETSSASQEGFIEKLKKIISWQRNT